MALINQTLFQESDSIYSNPDWGCAVRHAARADHGRGTPGDREDWCCCTDHLQHLSQLSGSTHIDRNPFQSGKGRLHVPNKVLFFHFKILFIFEVFNLWETPNSFYIFWVFLLFFFSIWSDQQILLVVIVELKVS
jgi:hypothetical protein